MAYELYQQKLYTIYLDMNTLGTHYNGDSQDFIDSFFGDDGELYIKEYKDWEKLKIDKIWSEHIKRKN